MALTDTSLFTRAHPGGRFSVVNKAAQGEGLTWWVSSTATSATDAAGYGLDPQAPFATLVYALTRAAAGAASGVDDVIYVMQGHTETLANAAGAAVLTLPIAGLKVIGIGGRTRKPIFLIDGHANNYVSITGADTVLENVTLSAGHADIASAIIVAADGVEIRKVDFIENVATENFLECINDGAANTCDKLLVEHCEFIQPDASNTAAIVFDAAQDRCIIRHNIFLGDWTKAIDGAGIPTNIILDDNLYYNAAADADSIINMNAGATGVARWNMGANANAAQANAMTGTAIAGCENYFGIVSEDLSGVLDPIAT